MRAWAVASGLVLGLGVLCAEAAGAAGAGPPGPRSGLFAEGLGPGLDRSGTVLLVFGTLLAVGVLGTMYRLVRGPTVADRVVALDVLGFLTLCLLGVLAITTRRAELLSVALVAGLILFLGTAGFAVYLERKGEG